MMTHDIEEFVEQLAAKGLRPTRLCVDSRQVRPGSLFFALKGTVVDGFKYIDVAIQNGAVGLIVDRPVDTSLPTLLVENLSQNASSIAHSLLNFDYPNIIGVTGTNGKTSIATWLSILLANSGKNSASIGTLGVICSDGGVVRDTGLTTPGAVDLQMDLKSLCERNVTDVAIEVSSHALSQYRVADLNISTAIFTNLTRDHLDYHGTMQDYFDAKAMLFDMPSVVHRIINLDDYYGRELATRYPDAITYSLRCSARLTAENLKYRPDGISFTLRFDEESCEVHLNLMGEFNVYNSLAVTGALLANGVSFKRIGFLLSTLKPVAGRMEPVKADDLGVIVDYAHTPDALANVLSSVKKHASNEVICVFGCGGDRDSGKRPLMAKAVDASGVKAVVTSDNNRTESFEKISAAILTGFERSTPLVISDRQEAITTAITTANPGDIVVVAGKGHESYIDEAGVTLPWSEFTAIAKALAARRGD